MYKIVTAGVKLIDYTKELKDDDNNHLNTSNNLNTSLEDLNIKVDSKRSSLSNLDAVSIGSSLRSPIKKSRSPSKSRIIKAGSAFKNKVEPHYTAVTKSTASKTRPSVSSHRSFAHLTDLESPINKSKKRVSKSPVKRMSSIDKELVEQVKIKNCNSCRN